MSQEAHPASGPAMPTLPERSMRRSEDVAPLSESYDNRRTWRQSEQATPTRPAGSHPGYPRPSEDRTAGPQIGYPRPSEDGPSNTNTVPPNQQLTPWQPTDDSHLRSTQRPAYTHSPSQDYGGFDDIEPTQPKDYYLVPRSAGENGLRHQRSDASAQQPYRRHAYRESTDTYRPLRTEQHTPRRPTINRPRWTDGYEDEPSPPQRRTPQKSRGQIYLVREGGDGGDGSDPPGEMLRLPFMDWMQGDAKNHFIAFLGEFVGTTMFLFFAFAGTIVANVGAAESATQTTTNGTVGFSPIVNLYVAVAFGFSLMVNVWIFFRVSGGLFNPAVTLGMLMTKTINYTRGFLLVVAQLTGAIVASFIVQVLFPSEFNVRTTLSPQTSVARGVIIEAFLTAELVFTVFMLAKEKHRATYMAPIGIGMALFVAELVGVFFTGGSLNPARSFGPCVATRKFDSEHWIYWVGPGVGAIAAFMFYRFIKILEYEMANPGQDAEDPETARLEAKEMRGEV